jgi:6-pyruvoyltetrahydropterin/6-carboxytetrahydropterin synthase
MYRIAKKFSFDAAHCLPYLPKEHKCSRLHGHTYTVELILQESIGLDTNAFVLDYGLLKPFKDYIDTHLDHQNLNTVLDPMKTTAENIAYKLYHIAVNVLREGMAHHGVLIEAVRVSETPNTWAEYSRIRK